MPPSVNDSKNLGAGVSTILRISMTTKFYTTNRFYATENPLFIGEYHQDLSAQTFLQTSDLLKDIKIQVSQKNLDKKLIFFRSL